VGRDGAAALAALGPAEVEAAAELRTAVVDIVLRRAEELADLSERLTSINKELEAFSYSVSHDLRRPFRHIVGYAELLKKFEGDKLSERGNRFVETIIESAVSAGTLVDDLLSFSQMGRASLTPVPIDMNALVAEERRKRAFEDGGRSVEWQIAELAPAKADPTMLRLVIQNLLENAVKFSRDRDPAVIEVGSLNNGGETVYFVRDNGVGFDQAYVGKLFGVFQRLHRVEEFEGTGIGLANVKRIVERHGGRVWAEGQLDGARPSSSRCERGSRIEDGRVEADPSGRRQSQGRELTLARWSNVSLPTRWSWSATVPRRSIICTRAAPMPIASLGTRPWCCST
jgi:light-regulated signal transduction histidine kinase (bacteriophytochrome)